MLWFWLVRVWYVSVYVVFAGVGVEIGVEDYVADVRGGDSTSRCVVAGLCVFDGFTLCACQVNVRVFYREIIFCYCVFNNCDCVCDFLFFPYTTAGGYCVLLASVVSGEMEESSEYPCRFFFCASDFV